MPNSSVGRFGSSNSGETRVHSGCSPTSHEAMTVVPDGPS